MLHLGEALGPWKGFPSSLSYSQSLVGLVLGNMVPASRESSGFYLAFCLGSVTCVLEEDLCESFGMWVGVHLLWDWGSQNSDLSQELT